MKRSLRPTKLFLTDSIPLWDSNYFFCNLFCNFWNFRIFLKPRYPVVRQGWESGSFVFEEVFIGLYFRPRHLRKSAFWLYHVLVAPSLLARKSRTHFIIFCLNSEIQQWHGRGPSNVHRADSGLAAQRAQGPAALDRPAHATVAIRPRSSPPGEGGGVHLFIREMGSMRTSPNDSSQRHQLRSFQWLLNLSLFFYFSVDQLLEVLEVESGWISPFWPSLLWTGSNLMGCPNAGMSPPPERGFFLFSPQSDKNFGSRNWPYKNRSPNPPLLS